MKKVIVNNYGVKMPYVVPKTECIEVKMEDGFLMASASSGSEFGGQITNWGSGDDDAGGTSNNWN